MTNAYRMYTVLRYSWWWTVDLSETCRVLYQINERLCISQTFIIRICQISARQDGCVTSSCSGTTVQMSPALKSVSLNQNIFLLLRQFSKNHFSEIYLQHIHYFTYMYQVSADSGNETQMQSILYTLHTSISGRSTSRFVLLRTKSMLPQILECICTGILNNLTLHVL